MWLLVDRAFIMEGRAGDFFSYARNRARGDLNEFSHYLRNFPSSIVEHRGGFPYAVTDVARNYVGTPNQLRFPNLFSFDAHASKDFKVNDRYSLLFAVSGLNLTNHFNTLDARANTADPQFGTFFGNYKRRFRMDFAVIY